jgi:hypothetical protein
MSPRRTRFRPPGLKPWTRIGTLGPFRGRLGLSWVVAALLAGAVIIGAGWYSLTRSHPPGGSFVSVGPTSSFHPGSAREVYVPGAFVAAVSTTFIGVLQEDGCTLRVVDGHYRDCRGAVYDFTGAGAGGCGSLDLLPTTVYRGTVYVDPDHPVIKSPAPPSGEPCP